MRNKKTIEKHRRLFILLPLVMGVFLWSLSAGIINISLPTLSQYLDISTSMVTWVVIIHLVILTSFLLIFGRVGDFIGYKKIFMMGLFIFAAGAYLCAVSLNFYHLLLFRIIQGIGSSMLLSVIPAIITLSFRPENRGKAFGYISLATTIGLSLGYGLGGFIDTYANWRWIFIVNIPLAILTIYLAHKYIPVRQKLKKPSSFDFIGSILALLTIISFLLLIQVVRNINTLPHWFPLGLILVTMLGVCFVIWEWKHESPLFDLHVLRNVYLTTALLATFLANLVLTGTIFLVPFYLELIHGYSADFAGMIILLPSLLILVTGPLSGHLSDRIGSKPVAIFSALALIISTLIFTIMDLTVGILFIFIALAIRSLCEGMFGPANNKMVMSHSSSEKTGAISSLMNTARYLGLVMGMVIFQGIFDSVISAQSKQVDIMQPIGAYQLIIPKSALLTGFQSAFFIGMSISVVIIILSFLTNEKTNT